MRSRRFYRGYVARARVSALDGGNLEAHPGTSETLSYPKEHLEMLENPSILVTAAPRQARNQKSGRETSICPTSAAPPRKLKEKIQSGDKLAFTIEEAVQSSSLGQTSIYQAIKDKKLIMRKYGSRSVITRGDLVAFLNSLPTSE
jgi:hypothetical protein